MIHAGTKRIDNRKKHYRYCMEAEVSVTTAKSQIKSDIIQVGNQRAGKLERKSRMPVDKMLFDLGEPVKLKSPWPDIIHSKRRWLQWLEIAQKEDVECFERWTDLSGCIEEGKCDYLDEKSFWCKAMGLPITYNHILTEKCGMIGMACMGFGHTINSKQTMFDEDF